VKTGGINVTAGISTFQAVQGTTGTFTSSLTINTTTDQMLNLNSTDNGGTYIGYQRSGTRTAYLGHGGTGSTFTLRNEIENGNVDIRGNDGGSYVTMLNLNTGDGGTATFSSDLIIPDKIIHSGDTNTAIRFPAADTITAETGGSERVRITSGGNIGIGTDNPAQAVHVNRSSGDTYIRAQGGTNQGLLINKTDGTLLGGFVSGGAVGGSANDIAVRAETGNNIVFAHGTTERLRVDSGGNLSVGVNTNPGGNRLLITDSHTEAFVNPTDSILRITNSNSSADTNQASICFTCSTTGSGADSAIVSQADDSSGNSRLEFWTDTNNGMTEKLSIRGSDGRVTVTNDIEFSTSGTGGLFGKFAVTNQAYTANANLDIAITQGNYIFSVRSGGVYHFNAIYMVTYYDSADKDSHEILHGDYGTTATHTVIHNSNNNGTFRLTFNRNFDGINVRQLKLS